MNANDFTHSDNIFLAVHFHPQSKVHGGFPPREKNLCPRAPGTCSLQLTIRKFVHKDLVPASAGDDPPSLGSESLQLHGLKGIPRLPRPIKRWERPGVCSVTSLADSGFSLSN